jgi:peptidyl-prolyl cis-trans isomerase SurA
MNNIFIPGRFSWIRCAALIGAALLLSPAAWSQSSTSLVRSSDFVVAVVNSEPITNQEVQALSLRLQREARAQGLVADPAESKRLALDQLINEKAQIQQAIALGISVDDAAVNQAESNVASNNQISVDALRQRLQQDGMSLASFREQLRNQLLLSRVREREVEARVRITDLEINQFLAEQLQRQAARNPADLNLGMILIAVPENASDEQVARLSERARSVAQRARQGDDFSALVAAFSEAPDRSSNGGIMGLRPLTRYPDLFVQAVDKLPIGGVSEVVRSGAGFHVLKVIQRQTAPTTLMATHTRARHILLRPSAQLSQTQAVAQLNAIRRDILSGRSDFSDVAKRISQDGSAPQGGDLGWASPGMFVPEFEQVMNQLRPGQLAEPLVSRFGVHLIEVIDRRDAPMSDAEQRNLARNTLRESKLDEAYAGWVQEIRGRAFVELREAPQ